MKNITLLLVVMSVILSCKKEQKEVKEATQMERVIAVHDEVMPKMGTIGKLINKLEPMVDSTAIGKQHEVAIKDLKEGYNLMMDWMKGFGDKFDSDEIMKGKALTEEKQTWLIEEEEKVNIMRDKINSSIANAETLLKEANKE
jgi:preprotein translocase subunit YajC